MDDNGRLTTDRLHPYFEAEGYECKAYDYGLHFAVSLRNRKWAKDLASWVAGDSIGIGHSNGCAILRRASLLGAPFSQLVFINPALDADAEIGPQVKACHVWYSPFDVGLRIAKYFPWSEWGSMGSTGATGTWPPFVNYNKAGTLFTTRSYTHLDIFLPDRISYFGPIMARCVKELE